MSRVTPSQPQNPRTISPRSHASSLVGSTSREEDTGWSSAKWDRVRDVKAAEQTAHPKAVGAGGRVSTQPAEEPLAYARRGKPHTGPRSADRDAPECQLPFHAGIPGGPRISIPYFAAVASIISRSGGWRV